MKALIINEMQNDLCNPGPFYNQNSLEIIPTINRIKDSFQLSIFIINSYSKNHSIFQKQGGKFLENCIEDTPGCEIYPFINIKKTDPIIKKSTLQSYESSSGFFDAEIINKQTDLLKILKLKNITELYFCGNGIDRSILSTIIDAIKYKFKCFVVENGISYKNKINFEKCKKFLINSGVVFVNI